MNICARRATLALALAMLIAGCGHQTPAGKGTLPRLTVSENGHYLQNEGGQTFFWMGDTAWQMFHRLTRREAAEYLEKRAAQGFNVVQAVALAEFGGLTEPNAAGDLPLIENDPARPNPRYFEQVDFMVEAANRAGIYVGLLPTWGDKVNKERGTGPEIFTVENARAFGRFLGQRYRNRGVVWVLGGDRPIAEERHLLIWRAMARGLRDGDGGRNLITYHPQGPAASSTWLHNEPWLDFNMIQSGHWTRYNPNYTMIAADFDRKPPKPVLDSEPTYEGIAIGFRIQNGRYTAHDARIAAYWAVFAGACGHTYGSNDVWQFYSEDRKPLYQGNTPWRQALDQPGGSQMRHLKNLVLSRPDQGHGPDQALLKDDLGQGADHAQAMRAGTSSAMIYIPTGKPVVVRAGELGGRLLSAWWYDPRTGQATFVDNFVKANEMSFTPPSEGAEMDWVLVLDDAAAGYGPPGRPQGR